MYTIKYLFSNGFEFNEKNVSLDLFEPIVKFDSANAMFSFASKNLVADSIPMSVEGKNIKHFEACGILGDKVKVGMNYEKIDKIELTPQMAEDYGFSDLN